MQGRTKDLGKGRFVRVILRSKRRSRFQQTLDKGFAELNKERAAKKLDKRRAATNDLS